MENIDNKNKKCLVGWANCLYTMKSGPPSYATESKVKIPPGCLSVEQVSWLIRSSMSLEPNLSTMPLSSALSQLHTFWMAQLLLTPHLRCAKLNLQTFTSFVPSIIHNLTGPASFPNGFNKLSWQEREPSNPDERAGTLTRQPVRLALLILKRMHLYWKP